MKSRTNDVSTHSARATPALAEIEGLRILIVDDDPGFRRLATMALEEAGIEHIAVSTAKEGLQALQATGASFDLILLDMELPGMKGWELLKLLRDSGREIPVVLVTVLEDVQAKVRALDLGADDYVVKPCSFEELLSRVQAVLRRAPGRYRIALGDLEIDPLLRRVRRNGRPVELTPREFELLALLAGEPGRVQSKAELLRRVWQVEAEPSTNFLQVHFSRLKQKLSPMDKVRIETVYGVGYRLVESRANEDGARNS
jgi:DNA-binding response OmpR family regulator